MHRFSPAGLNPVQRAALAENTNAQQQQLAALVASLSELRHHLMVASPRYAYSDPQAFGGPTTTANGAYAVTAPFDTPCQYRVVQIAFTGAGTALVSAQQGQTAPGNTATIDPTTRTYAQVFAAPGALTVSGTENWTDIPGNAPVYLAVAVTGGNSAFCTVQFRRRVSPAGLYAEGHS